MTILQRTIAWILFVGIPYSGFAQGVVEPDLIIHPDGPHHILTDVRSAYVDEDGILFAVQPVDGIVRVFGDDGMFVGELGRPGEGPGEFSYPDRIGVYEDYVWVSDLRHRRLYVFDREGSYRKTLTSDHDASAVEDDGTLVLLAGIAADGALIVETTVPDRATVTDGPVLATILRQEEDRLHPLASFDHQSRAWQMELANGQQYIGRNPISRNTLHTLRPDGSAVVLLDRSDTDERPQIRIVDSLTGASTSFSLPFEPIDVTPALRRQFVASVVERFMQFNMPGLSERQMRERVQAGLRFPNYLAPLTELVVSTDNTIWVRQFTSPDAELATWHAFAPDGSPRSTVILPSSARMVAANSSTVWTADERDGLPVLLRYPI